MLRYESMWPGMMTAYRRANKSFDMALYSLCWGSAANIIGLSKKKDAFVDFRLHQQVSDTRRAKT